MEADHMLLLSLRGAGSLLQDGRTGEGSDHGVQLSRKVERDGRRLVLKSRRRGGGARKVQWEDRGRK